MPNSKLFTLTPDLANLINANRGDNMSRPDISKRIFDYIKENKTYFKGNKQIIVPDEKMAKVFGRNKMKAYSLDKELNKYLDNNM